MPKASTLPPEPLKTTLLETKGREDDATQTDFEALVSPAKGILLTPGIGSTRRKNVTFRGIGSDEKSKARDGSADNLLEDTTTEASVSRSQVFGLIDNQPRQTSLTKALYRAKDRVSSGDLISSPGASRSDERVPHDLENDRPANITETEGKDLDVADELTIDLRNPHSRSGQHWKAEFERYHTNSNREMKKVLKVNQKVKSFAVKKDSEASDLGEKLQRELSRVAEMENKVTDLATQLAATRRQGLKETPDQTKLVNELARQTALAIRYKQKADNYKIALMKRNVSLATETDGNEDVVPQRMGVKPNQGISDPTSKDQQSQDMDSLRSELDRFRNSAEVTEQKAATLETKNLALQAEIDRLRQEMKISESKRQARDEILQRPEEVRKASNADCNARSPNPSTTNQALLQDAQRHHEVSITSERKTSTDYGEISSIKISQDKVATGKPTSVQDHLKPHKNTKAFDPESSMADIWILGGQDSILLPEKPRKNKNSFKHSPKILKEITQNRGLLEEENRKPYRTTPKSTPLKNPRPLSKTPLAYEFPHSTISFSSRKRLPTSSGTKPRTLTRPSITNSPSPRPSTPKYPSTSNPPKRGPVPSTQHSTQQQQHVMNSDHYQQLLSKSPVSGPLAQTKSPLNQGTTGKEAETGNESEPEIPMPVPDPAPAPVVDRKTAMRARMAERMAQNKKKAMHRGEMGMAMGTGEEV